MASGGEEQFIRVLTSSVFHASTKLERSKDSTLRIEISEDEQVEEEEEKEDSDGERD